MNGMAANGDSSAAFLYYIIYKPYGVLSQFSSEGDHPGLGSLFGFPPDVYPVGRLDVDSEGLLLLTNDTALNQALLNPRNEHGRTYWVQVEGIVTPQALEKLQQGVTIRIQKKDYKTLPAEAGMLQSPPLLPERNPPIRYRQNIPTSWLYLRLQEGKNRQVRRMTAAVGFPTLRLVRAAIEDLQLQSMQPGEVRELSQSTLFKLLRIEAAASAGSSGFAENKGAQYAARKRHSDKGKSNTGKKRL